MCTTSNVSIDQRLLRISSPLNSNIRAAAIPKRGAVKKKRSGTESGGVWESERKAIFIVNRLYPSILFEPQSHAGNQQPDVRFHLCGMIVTDKQLTKSTIAFSSLHIKMAFGKIGVELAGCHAMNNMEITILRKPLQLIDCLNQRVGGLQFTDIKLYCLQFATIQWLPVGQSDHPALQPTPVHSSDIGSAPLWRCAAAS